MGSKKERLQALFSDQVEIAELMFHYSWEIRGGKLEAEKEQRFLGAVKELDLLFQQCDRQIAEIETGEIFWDTRLTFVPSGYEKVGGGGGKPLEVTEDYYLSRMASWLIWRADKGDEGAIQEVEHRLSHPEAYRVAEEEEFPETDIPKYLLDDAGKICSFNPEWVTWRKNQKRNLKRRKERRIKKEKRDERPQAV